MGKFFVKNEQIADNKIIITGSDVNHIKNVLRLKIGDLINICDSDTSENYVCEIQNIFPDIIENKIVEKKLSQIEGNVELHIFQGLPKSEKMELVIQKGTELGVTEFIPVKFSRCIVKLDRKDETKKIERWNKISEVAAKQCGRDIVPKVRYVETIKQVCDQVNEYDLILVAYELEDKNYIKSELLKIKETKESYKIGVVIGPEGGIEESEIDLFRQSGAKIITLGKRILRTETVAIQVSSVIMYELENGGN